MKRRWRFSSHKYGDRSLLSSTFKSTYFYCSFRIAFQSRSTSIFSSFYFFNFIRRIHSLSRVERDNRAFLFSIRWAEFLAYTRICYMCSWTYNCSISCTSWVPFWVCLKLLGKEIENENEKKVTKQGEGSIFVFF